MNASALVLSRRPQLVLNALLCLSTLFVLSGVNPSPAQARNLHTEAIAGIYIGEELGLLQERIGQPQRRSQILYDPSDRCRVQVLFYLQLGVEVGVCKRRGEWKVRSLRLTEDSAAKTSSLCQLGDTLVRAREIYPGLRSSGGGVWMTEDTLHNIVLQLLIEDERVIEVNLIRPPGEPQGRIRRRSGYR